MSCPWLLSDIWGVQQVTRCLRLVASCSRIPNGILGPRFAEEAEKGHVDRDLSQLSEAKRIHG